MTRPRFSACAALFIFITAASVRAQDPPQTPPPAPTPTQAPAAAPQTSSTRTIQYGVRFGPSFTSLTSVQTFSPEDVPVAVEPTMNFGGFMTIGFGGPLTFQPELLFAAKGHRIRDKDAPPVNTGSGQQEAPADRVILIRYLEFPLLARVSKQTHERTSLYLIFGPSIAFKRNAEIRQVADPGRHTDLGEQVKGGNFLLIVGGGLQHKRWLVDARLTRGLSNVAVEPDPAPVKTNAFSVLLGVRL